MDNLVSRALTHRYSEMFMSAPTVDVPVGHLRVAERALLALKALDPRLRVSTIYRDPLGLMCLDVAVYPHPAASSLDIIEALVDGCPDDQLLDRIAEITAEARTLSAWSCIEDGRPGWRVDGPKGPTILCPDCQKKHGMEVKRHEA